MVALKRQRRNFRAYLQGIIIIIIIATAPATQRARATGNRPVTRTTRRKPHHAPPPKDLAHEAEGPMPTAGSP